MKADAALLVGVSWLWRRTPASRHYSRSHVHLVAIGDPDRTRCGLRIPVHATDEPAEPRAVCRRCRRRSR